jgi:hypothetical protein
MGGMGAMMQSMMSIMMGRGRGRGGRGRGRGGMMRGGHNPGGPVGEPKPATEQ